MKKNIGIISIIAVFLIIGAVLLLVRFSMINDLKGIEQRYETLRSVDVKNGTIRFKVRKDRIEEGNHVMLYSDFDSQEFMNAKNELQDKYGWFLMFYDMELEICGDGSEGPLKIAMLNYRWDHYENLIIDNSLYSFYQNATNYREYTEFDVYEIYGAMNIYGTEECENDYSFIENACRNGKIITDEHTLDTYVDITYTTEITGGERDYDVVQPFRRIIDVFEPQDIDISQSDLREYTLIVEHYA